MGSRPCGSPNLSGLPDPHQSFESEDCTQRYRRLFESAPLVAYSLDRDLSTLYVSPYCRKVFGYTHEEIQQDDRFWDRQIHPDDRQRVRLTRERHLREGNSFTLEYRIIHRDQNARHIINHTIPVISNHQLHCIDGFVFDITVRKHLEEQLVLTERIKVLNDMSLSVAHEIRNPLTSIGGFARLMDRRMASGDSNRPHLDIIIKEVTRLEMTLNRVLESLKRISLHLAPININDLIAEVIQQLKHEFHHMGVRAVTNLSSRIPEMALDRHLMAEGLRNILRIALQSMRDGDELTISTSLNHHNVIIEIKGISLATEPLDDSQLFFPFYREPTFDRGFGIPLSQQIITQHGGNVVFKNGYNHQASLIITLPVAPSQRKS
jgi:PAS domain S-box-containing protein